jgi:hypothetical protein
VHPLNLEIDLRISFGLLLFLILGEAANAGLQGLYEFSGRVENFDSNRIVLVDAIGQKWNLNRERFKDVDIKPGMQLRIWYQSKELTRVQARTAPRH